MKICPKCGNDEATVKFWKNKRLCNQCLNAIARLRWRNKPELRARLLKRQRARYQAEPQTKKQYYQENHDAILEKTRARNPARRLRCKQRYSTDNQYREKVNSKNLAQAKERSKAGKTKQYIESSARRFLCVKKWNIKEQLDFDVDFLCRLLEKQQSLCALSEVLPLAHKFNSLYGASIDRIDLTKPHKKDNIRLVCKAMNFARNNFTDQAFKSWLRDVIRGRSELTEIGDLQSYLADKLPKLISPARLSRKKVGCDITLSDLLALLKEQKELCPLTGVQLTGKRHDPYAVSIDRIIPNLGYTKGNIQLVCTAINYAKGSNSLNEIISFIADLRQRSSCQSPP